MAAPADIKMKAIKAEENDNLPAPSSVGDDSSADPVVVPVSLATSDSPAVVEATPVSSDVSGVVRVSPRDSLAFCMNEQNLLDKFSSLFPNSSTPTVNASSGLGWSTLRSSNPAVISATTSLSAHAHMSSSVVASSSLGRSAFSPVVAAQASTI